MSLKPLDPGDTVEVMLWRWQWEDGLKVEIGEGVSWSLMLQRDIPPDMPSPISSQFLAVVEPALGDSRAEPPFALLLRSGPLAAAYDATTHEVGELGVTGVVTADWYDRTPPQLKPTAGVVEAMRLVRADLERRPSFRASRFAFDALASAPALDAWQGPDEGIGAEIGVLVTLRL